MVITYPQWLMFGDSITQQSFCAGGLGQYLSDAYQRKIDIVNRGYSGYNSRWGLRVAPHVFPLKTANRPLKAMTIWWGANDACLPMRTQSIPLSEFKENLLKFIDMLRSSKSDYYSPDTIIFLLSPPPICVPQRREDVEARWGKVDLDRSFERTHDFAEAVKGVAKEAGVSFVPVFDKMMQAAGPNPDEGLRKFLSDGLHLTPEGYQVVVRALFEVLQAQHADLLPENVPRLFPEWAQIDPNDPDASIPKP